MDDLSISRQKQCPLGLPETDRKQNKNVANYKKIPTPQANCYQWQISPEIFGSLFHLLLIISSSLCQFPWCHLSTIPLPSLSVQFAKCLSSHVITKVPAFPLTQSPAPSLFLLLLGLTSSFPVSSCNTAKSWHYVNCRGKKHTGYCPARV